jgi:hypothetical protein
MTGNRTRSTQFEPITNNAVQHASFPAALHQRIFQLGIDFFANCVKRALWYFRIADHPEANESCFDLLVPNQEQVKSKCFIRRRLGAGKPLFLVSFVPSCTEFLRTSRHKL